MPIFSNPDRHLVKSFPGPDGLVCVAEQEMQLPSGKAMSRSIVQNDSYVLGGTLSRPDERRQALLPIFSHPDPRSVCFLGLATGITAGGALDVQAVKEVTAVELSQQVVDAAAEFFSDENGGLCDSSKASVVTEDARTWILSQSEAYDVVIGDLFRPYSTGEGRLFTHEHFEAVKRSLKPGGLYCQWLPMYQLSALEFEVILNTFSKTFPRMHIWRANIKSNVPILGLMGTRSGELDLSVIASHCESARNNGIMDPPARHAESVAMHYLGYLEHDDCRTEITNDLDNAWVELHAGLRHIQDPDGKSCIANKSWVAFETDMIKRIGGRTEAAELAKWSASGQFLSQWYYAASIRDPRTGALQKRAFDSLPQSLKDDENADWSYWPEM